MGYLGKHRVFRPMRRHPAVLISGGATALVVVVTGVVAAKIAHDSQTNTKITQVAVANPTGGGIATQGAGATAGESTGDPGISSTPTTRPPGAPAVGGHTNRDGNGNATGNKGSSRSATTGRTTAHPTVPRTTTTPQPKPTTSTPRPTTPNPPPTTPDPPPTTTGPTSPTTAGG